MMKKIVLATNNPGKLREFNNAFKDNDVEFVSLKEIKGAPDVEETGETYEDNARLKARAIAQFTGKPTVADDSGIEINAMPGELGVRSARFAGGKSPSDANEVILNRLNGADDRGARYICVVIYYDPDTGEEKVTEGMCEGTIHDKQEGYGGFGHDPIFYLPEYGKTMAQIPMDEKNRISHRAKAIEQLKDYLSIS